MRALKLPDGSSKYLVPPFQLYLAFADQMEKRMLEALDEETFDDSTPHRYARVGVGRQKTLGYLVWLLCYIHRAARRKEVDRVRHLALSGLMMAEQSCLDNNWLTAWELSDLPRPPFSHWSSQDIAAMQRETAKSKLSEQSWRAVIAAKVKDDAVLTARRGKGGGNNPKEKEAEC